MNLATKLFYYQYNHPKLEIVTSKFMRFLFSCDVAVKVMGGEIL